MNLIVGNISNLTDARYFSAMGAEALIFPIDVPPARVKEIAAWISGPNIWVDTSIENPVYSIADYDYSRIVASELADPGHRQALLVRKYSSIPTKLEGSSILDFEIDGETLHQVMSNNSHFSVYISIDKNSIENLLSIADLGIGLGYYLEGSREETIGLKSYEKMDILLDEISFVPRGTK